MAAPNFEFIVEGPAVPLRAVKQNAKRYQAWKKKVCEEAAKLWQSETRPILGEVTVTITNYFTDEPPDVDNIIKPILDALNLLVYDDDFQVQSVTSRKFELDISQIVSPPILVNAANRAAEVIHIEVFGRQNHERKFAVVSQRKP